MASSSKTKCIKASMGIADTASWYCAIVLVGLIILVSMSIKDEFGANDESSVRSGRLPFEHGGCDEIYVVGEGETLHTISDKCGDPFIVEQNPHIHDPDDVFPGLVIKIIPFNTINVST